MQRRIRATLCLAAATCGFALPAPASQVGPPLPEQQAPRQETQQLPESTESAPLFAAQDEQAPAPFGTDEAAQSLAAAGDANPAIKPGWQWDTWLALAGVVGVIILLSMLMKRSVRGAGLVGSLGPGGPSPAGLLAVLGRYPVGPRQQLVLLRVHDRVVLLDHEMGKLGRGGGAMRAIYTFDDPADVADLLARARDDRSESVAGKFRDLMHRFGGDAEPTPTETSLARRTTIHETGDITEFLDDSHETVEQFETEHQPVPNQHNAPSDALAARLQAMREQDSYQFDEYQSPRAGGAAW